MNDLIILGGGPAGYTAAIKAAKKGLKVTLIEKENLGGTCLNYGCIPTKALLKTAYVYDELKKSSELGVNVDNYTISYEKIIERSRNIVNSLKKGLEFLIKKNNIDLVKGHGKIISQNKILIENNGNKQEVEGKFIIIATGAVPKNLNYCFDNEFIWSYKEALTIKELPKKILIVGGGPIGCEFSYFFQVLGSNVILVEYMPHILPNFDYEISQNLEINLKKLGVTIYTSSTIENIDTKNKKITIISNSKEKIDIIVDKVIIAVGTTANIENIGIEEIGIKTINNKIEVNDKYMTNLNNIFAIGDVINTPALAHVAMAEAKKCIDVIINVNSHSINYNLIPYCVYTNPEVAFIGFTEKQAKEQKINYKVSKIPLAILGKAKAINNYHGFAKVIYDLDNKKILGVSIIGPNATEIISEFTLIINENINLENISYYIHPHPTISEIVPEITESLFNNSIHY